MVVLLSGLLPNPKLDTSVLSISLNTCWMVYMVSVGIGGAISTRVSNELGAGNSPAARLALRVMIIMATSEGATVGITTIVVRHIWGKLYSNEEEVIKYVAKMMPLLALSDFLDGFQCVLSGAARGCGWQNLCVIINRGAYYGVAIPCAVIFAFYFQVGGMGLWMGIICGPCVQIIALVTVNAFTNWDQETTKAMHKALKSTGLVWIKQHRTAFSVKQISEILVIWCIDTTEIVDKISLQNKCRISCKLTLARFNLALNVKSSLITSQTF
ncbi:hypothetical protein Ddye_030113 [Dipteronia dyeriana]|uniref:Uncharacterized protein n=1 Tax=Dipteronia dyeriana TaxID=168575 RepID=A0AAD9TG31_9ROSI|nr:hypothetical protein Ddye_030113 [Dipteronia dyeriana]